jgi:hypothetical protein
VVAFALSKVLAEDIKAANNTSSMLVIKEKHHHHI